MRTVFAGVIAVCSLASSALAGITVTSYRTTAHTNAFAPVGGSQYISDETLNNISPAEASVFGDWTGPNAGGMTDTWHWVGSAETHIVTSFNDSILSITGFGSFAHQLTTTSDFVDPRSAGVFTPGSAADYRCTVTVDVPTFYTISVELGQFGRISLTSPQTGFIFDETNFDSTPRVVQLSGTLPSGSFAMRANTSIGAPNFANGVNDYLRSGGFEDLSFTLQIPEPGSALFVGAAVASSMLCKAKRGTLLLFVLLFAG